ncbi:MAG: tRNA uridine-5-carboxymethylaminomethyl(34) synthesis enzyme MnmG [Chloroflexi bacterium]|nr:tRNA uridine-5-carboxymethylaminomethyl(34) synthesis enzyme MnmG [Chloroflexota bacterium]
MYDVMVVGAGHAGCEAALAAARMGCKTLVVTMKLEHVALMPCNPSIGGPAKGHMAREIDALGGEMGKNIDKTFIQIRMLNTGKGPAVQALRAQADKGLYALEMRRTLEGQENLTILQALVEDIGVVRETEGGGEGLASKGLLYLKTRDGVTLQGKTVIMTTGTSLAGRIIMGERSYTGGRAGEPAATEVSKSLRRLGFKLGRHKTGTPPRLEATSIDFTKTELQPGSQVPLYFSHWGTDEGKLTFLRPNPAYPPGPVSEWRPQLPCYLVHTNERTHQIIRDNLHRAPMFNGTIDGVGPRYCPSIEDKVVRFAHKDSHGLFLEPEGWETSEVYLQGANTSLPEDVQEAMVRSIPALERARILKMGYAIEYDFVVTSQVQATLESKLVPGLYFAGQICGTSGYEEAAGQGLLAGINAALKVKGKAPLILRRDQAYLGVMIDDLVTRDHFEPYRMMTSRAEYRLLLRQDNADLRLSPTGFQVGLLDRARYEKVEGKRHDVARELERLARSHVPQIGPFKEMLETYGLGPVNKGLTALEFLRRPEVDYEKTVALGLGDPLLDPETRSQVEIEAKYQSYIVRQMREVERIRRMEERALSEDIDYREVTGLSNEARDNLQRFRPLTVGQASRIAGITPSDLGVLLVYLERRRKVYTERDGSVHRKGRRIARVASAT